MAERHKCFVEVDALLGERNTRLFIPDVLGGIAGDQTERLLVVTEQVEAGRDKRKACGVFASFCPFCGESLRAAA